MVPPVPDRLLTVDLSSGSVESTPIPDEWRQRYLGGKGLGARYLYDELDAGVDPLGDENALLFMLGPLSGYLPGESRYAAITKSPLTGCFLDSYAGGEFPDSLAGALGPHMGLLVTGVASDPVTLVIEGGDATIAPAETWGADTVETARAFPDASVACIGPAGEHHIAYATIASDEGEHHAGRGGAGAVMGSKRLKAVVARGEPPEGFDDLREAYAAKYRETATGRWLRASGTVETIDFANEIGALSTRGWRDGHLEQTDELGITAVEDSAVGREYADTAAPGGFRVPTDEGDHVPRGATAMTLGAGLDIHDFDAVAELGQTCDRLGMDLISAGSAVAWTINADAAGVLDRPLSFGDADGARALLREIANRTTDLGDALADGVDAAASRYGGRELVPTVKSMELPAYDPRGAQSMALAYATSDRGACHRRARPIEREAFDGEWGADRTAEAVVREQDRRSVLWSLIADDFFGDALDDLGRAWLESVGLEPAGELATVGERIWNVTRLFNVREGISRADDALPATLQEPLERGPRAGAVVDRDDFDSMLDAYYSRRGWATDGVPTAQTIDRLDLTELAADLHALRD
ncbi:MULTISPECIES: aldehyde ferredoxin oxidoreductase family protein [Haloferax]|uniref:Putative oxidoreductase YdhV n=1 Tax=Haloferax massiliensis TaxID=1476858 RepID=A0A0D6JU91_9EURY|nr:MULTISPECIES: aldehyde ferredoxin oxidoreductase C-terminal domain-containing protein [Haloferax]MDS0241438.1 aldehyde ferredoxin oxidoreductase [Haloferax sp. S2CR25]MDS0444559.1 aldehyde ferredoxin oxidoreductase [Haloferax sp. S2CR25-2]CQR52101.1 putative oxidoreductase YdhV [Haloferax massiliensis]